MSRNSLQTLRDTMFRYARSILGTDAGAEDVVQDVFVKILSQKRNIRNMTAFALTSVRNRSLDELRHRKFISDTELPELSIEDGKKEAKEIVAKAMKMLPVQQREAIHLKDIEGYEMKEVAEIMEISEEYLRVVLSRGRKKLKDSILRIL